jgi:hypothetical protein
LNQPRQATSTCGLSSITVVFMRSWRRQNLVSAPAPSPSCIAWRVATWVGSTNSSQAIMRCTYSSSISYGSSSFIDPCTHSVPRCRQRTPL